MRRPALCLAILVASACAEDPSFTVEWSLATAPGEVGVIPKTEAECSAAGVDGIRVETFVEGEVVSIDSREFECAGGPGAGPALDPGSYRVEVSGVRRAGELWSCHDTALPLDVCTLSSVCNDSGTGGEWCGCESQSDCADGTTCTPRNDVDLRCDPNDLDTNIRYCVVCPVHAEETIDVVEDATVELETTLVTPPQCDDGIDNDGDGFTDGLDPACARDGLANEDDDAGDTVFALGVSFFDSSPAVDCFETRLTGFNATISIIGGDGTDDIEFTLPCSKRIPPFAMTLPGDLDYRLDVTGVQGVDVATVTHSVDFAVSATQGGFVGRTFDFDDDDFLTPIVGSVGFFPSYQFTSGVPARSGCMPSTSALSSLVLDELRITIFDENDTPVPLATLGITNAVDEGGGTFRLPCPSAGVFSDGDLTWDKYSVAVEGLALGETCFTTEDARALAPRTPQSIVLDRALIDGEPSAACRDCETREDCAPAASACIAGVCVA